MGQTAKTIVYSCKKLYGPRVGEKCLFYLKLVFFGVGKDVFDC